MEADVMSRNPHYLPWAALLTGLLLCPALASALDSSPDPNLNASASPAPLDPLAVAGVPAAPYLQVAGIKTVQEAYARLADIASAEKKAGPQLAVHMANWYRYRPQDMSRTLFWNGDAGHGQDRVVLEPKPLFGYYSCDDPQFIAWELQFSQALGVTELNIDYEGGVEFPKEFAGYYQKRFWDSWFLALLRQAEKSPVKISVMYEPKSIADRLALRARKTPDEMRADPAYAQQACELLKDDLRKICDLFTLKHDSAGNAVLNPAYKRVAGLPEISIFHMTASGLTLDIWTQAVRDLGREGYAFILIPNTYRDAQAPFDVLTQGLNPWLDQLFTGMQDRYPELWKAAQDAAQRGDTQTARSLANQYIDELVKKGLGVAAPVRTVAGAAHFNVAPLAISFQDAAVKAWGFRPPVYFEPSDRTRTEPGKLFRAFFQSALNARATKLLAASGDDMAEKSHLLIPDEQYGFSGPYALALAAAALGEKPDLALAIRLTEKWVAQKNHGQVPGLVKPVFEEAKRVLPAKLASETQNLPQGQSSPAATGQTRN
jgi:hypothetical protein